MLMGFVESSEKLCRADFGEQGDVSSIDSWGSIFSEEMCTGSFSVQAAAATDSKADILPFGLPDDWVGEDGESHRPP